MGLKGSWEWFRSLERSDIYGNEVRSRVFGHQEMKQRKKNNSHGEQ